ncbi:uncharacterized protein [Leptinotarsa decemlineata]|uniref:uncharacterized protein n=1 Tax=Leptinotarsa decemlineata TaxID=7539 RepID=UPI003D30A6D7
MHLIDSFSNPVTEPLLPDDIWQKFELDFSQLPGFSDTTVMPPEEHSYFPILDEVWAGNHDCMWAGHCGSQEHSNDEFRHVSRLIPTPGTSLMHPPPVPTIKREWRGSSCQQQSLLKPAVRATAPMLHTPPMSDDEEAKHSKPTSVLKLLRDAIDDCDLDEEVDLCNYLEGKGDADMGPMCTVKEEEEDEDEEEEDEEDDDDDEDEEEEVIVDIRPELSKINIKSNQAAAESDHSYHKGGQNSAMRLAEFGIDTPSDSEEEIDVVSVVDKMQFQNKVFSLPNNPTTIDRQHIQRRMATAISRRSAATQGIKTILPMRKPVRKPVETTPPTKRRAAAEPLPRGAKRSRQYRTTTANSTPYKRRAYGHSSDSDQEPSEKRNLHNNMERQRRIDLRNAFEDLRVLVPEVSKKERAAKVVILREAAQYCDNLTTISNNLHRTSEELNRKQAWLRWRVSELRRNLAAKR